MPKNTWDNRKRLADVRVATYTADEKHVATVTSIMHNYRDYDYRFQKDWQALIDTDPETEEVKATIVGDADAMRSLSSMIADINGMNPGALTIVSRVPYTDSLTVNDCGATLLGEVCVLDEGHRGNHSPCEQP